MKRVVIDSNILFSALIRDSHTRRVVIEYRGIFLVPSFVFNEIEEHKNELLEKSGMTNGVFHELLKILSSKLEIVPPKMLFPFIGKAYELGKYIAPDDSPFIACALAYPESLIWSDDKRLKKQQVINVLNTREFSRWIKEKP